jgi:hypothetical protein
MTVVRHLAVLALALAASFTAHAEPAAKPAKEVTFDGLERIDSERFALAWVRPDAHFSGYKRLLVLPAEISYKDPEHATTRERIGGRNDNFLLSESRMERLRKALRETFHEEIVERGGWQLAEEPAPDVLIVRGGLIDMIVRVPPQSGGRTRTYLASYGEATLVVELYDSQTRQILARIADRAAAEPMGGQDLASDLHAPAEVRRMFKRWAKRFHEALDEARLRRP